MRTDAKPNTGHDALARLEQLGCIRGVITQNIDGLHHEAGNEHVLELHGTARRVACLSARNRGPRRTSSSASRRERRIPSCTYCGGILKSATISFGQQLPQDVLEEAHHWSLEADVFLVVGSSWSWSSRPPTCPAWPSRRGEPSSRSSTGSRPSRTHFDDAVILGDAGPTLTAIVDRVERIRSATR